MASIDHRVIPARLFGWKFSSLGNKIVAYTLIVSTLFAIISTAVQLMFFFEHERADTLSVFRVIESSFLPSIEDALLRLDDAQVGPLLDGVFALDAVSYIRLITPENGDWTRGQNIAEPCVETTSTLKRTLRQGDAIDASTMTVGITFEHLGVHLRRQFVTTLLTNMAKTLAVGMLMMAIFDRLAAARLRKLADQVLTTSWRDATSKVQLYRANDVFPDEIDRIADALELMRTDAQNAYNRLAHEKSRADRLNDSLKSANAEQAELARAFSHELVTPINTLQMLLSELTLAVQDELLKLDQDQSDVLCDAHTTVDRMRAQLEGVVKYSVLLSSEPTFEHIDLDMLVSNCLADLKSTLDRRDADIWHGPLGHIYGDTSEVQMLLTEILSNAALYTPRDRALKIEISAIQNVGPEAVGLCISDNGQGMHATQTETAFALFKRLHGYADAPGAGVGLVLCRRVMERHNGAISLQPNPTGGTQVTLIFPKRRIT